MDDQGLAALRRLNEDACVAQTKPIKLLRVLDVVSTLSEQTGKAMGDALLERESQAPHRLGDGGGGGVRLEQRTDHATVSLVVAQRREDGFDRNVAIVWDAVDHLRSDGRRFGCPPYGRSVADNRPQRNLFEEQAGTRCTRSMWVGSDHHVRERVSLAGRARRRSAAGLLRSDS